MIRANRKFVQLANNYDDLNTRHRSQLKSGMLWASEKLDGMRALWLPCSRGMTINVFNDNTINNNRPATGLWSRYGKAIWAPKWFLDALPNFPLDGELFTSRGEFQRIVSITKKDNPIDSEWEAIKYMVFDSPTYQQVLIPGRINDAIWVEGKITGNELGLYEKIDLKVSKFGDSQPTFEDTYAALARHDFKGIINLVEQTPVDAIEQLDGYLTWILNQGGEGIILRNRMFVWEPYRTVHMLKMKPFKDSEARIIGYDYGRGKYQGMMGSLEMLWENPDGKTVTFELSGFTDSERQLKPDTVGFKMVHFNINDIITFRYRELTKDGKPKEARFLRKRTDR